MFFIYDFLKQNCQNTVTENTSILKPILSEYSVKHLVGICHNVLYNFFHISYPNFVFYKQSLI